MIRITLGLAAVLCIAACATDDPAAPRAGQSKAPPATDPSDTCGASQLKYLVGRPKTEIPVPVDPKTRRVTCTTCPVTMDFSPVRVNIFFDQASGIIKEVKCG